ncbi:hypothetical protein [Rubrivirga marina]|uniref:Uncharacterized protein n=1 Tax=Rubrivirga marina TaxID=1196024 RepID=A0A271ISK6_9BACT|nr:hypothetical protein [Rubrivirga marina]PAP74222.1 hypothetical protein BSZ37_21410 [Rubrivirga marina]
MLDHLDPFQRRGACPEPAERIALALYRMLTGPRFDICVVRNALTVADLHPERAAFEAVRLHHTTPGACPERSRRAEMPPGFRAALAAQTLALFTGRPASATADLRGLAGLAGVTWTETGTRPSALPPALA